MRYLNLCCVKHNKHKQIKDLPFIIDCELIRSFKKLFSPNQRPGKGYFAGVGTYNVDISLIYVKNYFFYIFNLKDICSQNM